MTRNSIEIVLDARRRTSLAKVGNKDHSRYLVEERPDGSLILTPAVTIPIAELAALSDPEIRAAIERARDIDRSDLVSRGSFLGSGKGGTTDD